MPRPMSKNDNDKNPPEQEFASLPSLKEAFVAAGVLALATAALVYEFTPVLPILQKTASQCVCDYRPFVW